MLWITRVTEQTVERQDGQGLYQVRMIVCEIAEPLTVDFVGVEPTRTDPATQGTNGTLVYGTRYNPGAVDVVGAAPVSAAAATGDYVVSVDSLYQPLIPTALAETALADTTPGGDSGTLVPGRSSGTISRSTTDTCMGPNLTAFLGSPIIPGSFSGTYGGNTFVDDADGQVIYNGATVIGTTDYTNGIIYWNSACPNTTTSNKTFTFTPAALPLRVAETAYIWVTTENRGFVWVKTLNPIPAPGSLRVSYRVNNEWYTLFENGQGTLAGVDSSYGGGTLNYSTGTVTITTGALPDPDSLILLSFGTPATFIPRGGSAVDPLIVRGQTSSPGVLPNTFSVSWDTYTLTDNGSGVLTGTGGTGTVDYPAGKWEVTPSTVPAIGTEFSVDYDYGEAVVDTFTDVDPDLNGDVNLLLSELPISGSIRIEYELYYGQEYDYVAKDDGSGNIILVGGSTGTVNYGTGEIVFNPGVTITVASPVYVWVAGS
jgi:hypothetical protein